MSIKLRKTINRIILFILSLPFAFIVLSPLLLIYAIFLATYPEGRQKLLLYYKVTIRWVSLILGCLNLKDMDQRKKSRSELWGEFKHFWDGKS
jgi:hypothetical protein